MNTWQTKKLGEVALFIGGYAFKSIELEKSKKDNLFLPVVKIGNLGTDSIIHLEDVQFYKFNNRLQPFLIKKDDVLIAMTGATVGKVAISDKNNLLLNQRVGLIRPKQGTLQEYIKYLLLNKNFYNYCQKKAGGGAQGNISPTQILFYDVYVPSLSTQQQIVEKLDAIRKLQELNNKEIEKAEELFHAFFNSTFVSTGNWQIKKIKDIAVINPPKPKFHEWDLEKEVDFLPMSALATDTQNPFPAEKRKLKQVIKGYTCFQSDDVLLAKITPCFENGKTGIFKKNPKSVGFGSTEFIIIRVDDKKTVPLWVWLFVFSNKFRQEGKLHMTGTAGQKRLPVSFVKNYQIPVPPLGVQQQIVDKFQNIASLFEIKKREKEKLSELFESALNKAMKGELIN